MVEEPIGRYEVQAMILTALEKYDDKQESRFREMFKRLNTVDSKLNRIIGALLLIAALIPVLDHLLR